jgi:hypothetical protein
MRCQTVQLEDFVAAFATPAALLAAAERYAGVAAAVPVDPHGAGMQLARENVHLT